MYGIDNVVHEEIYNEISKLFKIKFKSQLNNSPLQFRQFFYVKNLINGEEYYKLFLNRTDSIEFSDRDTFINELIRYLIYQLKQLESEQEYLDNIDFGGIKYDENQLYNQYEAIGWGMDKYPKIIKQLLKYKA